MGELKYRYEGYEGYYIREQTHMSQYDNEKAYLVFDVNEKVVYFTNIGDSETQLSMDDTVEEHSDDYFAYEITGNSGPHDSFGAGNISEIIEKCVIPEGRQLAIDKGSALHSNILTPDWTGPKIDDKYDIERIGAFNPPYYMFTEDDPEYSVHRWDSNYWGSVDLILHVDNIKWPSYFGNFGEGLFSNLYIREFELDNLTIEGDTRQISLRDAFSQSTIILNYPYSGHRPFTLFKTSNVKWAEDGFDGMFEKSNLITGYEGADDLVLDLTDVGTVTDVNCINMFRETNYFSTPQEALPVSVLLPKVKVFKYANSMFKSATNFKAVTTETLDLSSCTDIDYAFDFQISPLNLSFNTNWNPELKITPGVFNHLFGPGLEQVGVTQNAGDWDASFTDGHSPFSSEDPTINPFYHLIGTYQGGGRCFDDDCKLIGETELSGRAAHANLHDKTFGILNILPLETEITYGSKLYCYIDYATYDFAISNSPDQRTAPTADPQRGGGYGPFEFNPAEESLVHMGENICHRFDGETGYDSEGHIHYEIIYKHNIGKFVTLPDDPYTPVTIELPYRYNPVSSVWEVYWGRSPRISGTQQGGDHYNVPESTGFGYLCGNDFSGLSRVTIMPTIYPLWVDMTEGFAGCEINKGSPPMLSAFHGPDHGVTTAVKTFYNANIKDLKLSECFVKELRDASYMFQKYRGGTLDYIHDGLHDLTIGTPGGHSHLLDYWDFTSVIYATGMFRDATYMETDTSKGDLKNVYNGDEMFGFGEQPEPATVTIDLSSVRTFRKFASLKDMFGPGLQRIIISEEYPDGSEALIEAKICNSTDIIEICNLLFRSGTRLLTRRDFLTLDGQITTNIAHINRDAYQDLTVPFGESLGYGAFNYNVRSRTSLYGLEFNGKNEIVITNDDYTSEGNRPDSTYNFIGYWTDSETPAQLIAKYLDTHDIDKFNGITARNELGGTVRYYSKNQSLDALFEDLQKVDFIDLDQLWLRTGQKDEQQLSKTEYTVYDTLDQTDNPYKNTADLYGKDVTVNSMFKLCNIRGCVSDGERVVNFKLPIITVNKIISSAEMFRGMSFDNEYSGRGIHNIILTSGDWSNDKNMSLMFAETSSNKPLDINFGVYNMCNVEDMSNMFYAVGGQQLIPKTENGTFDSCRNLTGAFMIFPNQGKYTTLTFNGVTAFYPFVEVADMFGPGINQINADAAHERGDLLLYEAYDHANNNDELNEKMFSQATGLVTYDSLIDKTTNEFTKHCPFAHLDYAGSLRSCPGAFGPAKSRATIIRPFYKSYQQGGVEVESSVRWPDSEGNWTKVNMGHFRPGQHSLADHHDMPTKVEKI